MSDLRFALRQLLKSPGFTCIALVTLALGIGGSTAIFSVVDGVLLHPLPYPDSEKIVKLAETNRSSGRSREAASPGNFLDWAAQNDIFSQMAAGAGAQANLTDNDRPERVRVARTTGNFFALFAVAPLLGRALQPADNSLGHDRVAVLSFELWARRYGSDKSIVGHEILLDGEARTVVGVMPANFSPDDYAEIWLPSPFGVPPNALRLDEDPRLMRDSNYLDVWGRLKSGATLAQARAEMDAIAARLEKQFPDSDKDTGVIVTPLHEEVVGSLRPILLLLVAAVGALLFIGCANVANLLLARATVRAREISIRAALGASRSRLLRQLLTESLLLSLLGGALGVTLAAWAIPVLLSLSPPAMASFKTVGLNVDALAFSVAAAVLTGILFGLAPAITASAAAPATGLKEGERGGTAGNTRGRAILITLEVALSLLLLVGAGLLTKSFAHVASIDPGFNRDHLLIFSLGAPARLEQEQQNLFYRQTLDRLRELPGVERVGAVSRLPLSGGNSARSLHLPGSTVDYEADIRVATPDYFSALKIPLVRGRNFDQRDTSNAPPVAIINEAAARILFPNGDPIGKVVTDFGPKNLTLQIIGVIGNVRHLSLANEPRAEVYQPLGQAIWPNVFVTVRTKSASPLSVLSAAQNAVWSVNKNVPLGNPRTMQDFVARSLSQRKFTMLLLAIFAGIALLLAAIGLYGVISYSVAQRTRELGIRIALGAQRGDVLALVLGEGMLLVGAGIALGFLASLGLTRLIASLLFGVSATDPLTFVAVSLALCAVALLACFVPARRASGVDPIVALRAD